MLRPTKNPRIRGTALLAAMCFSTVLAIAISSYLLVAYRALQFSSRGAHLANSLSLAEMGLEDALWAMNKYDWSATGNGWTFSGTTANRTITGFTYSAGATGEIRVRITDYNKCDPNGNDYYDTNAVVTHNVYAEGRVTLADGTVIRRQITTEVRRTPVFSNALSGLDPNNNRTVRFRRNGWVDNYDSAVGSYASQTAGANAIVAGPTVTLTNAQIYGFVVTDAANTSDPSYSGSAKIYGPETPIGTNIDTGRMSNNLYQPDFGPGSIPAGLPFYTYLPSWTIGNPGDPKPTVYYLSNLYMWGSDTLTIDGPVILSVSNDVFLWSNAKIVVSATGSLQLRYGGDLDLGGRGIENNTIKAGTADAANNHDPSKVFIVNTSSGNDAPRISTSQEFHGVIYAPKDTLTITQNITMYGAIVAKRIYFSSNSSSNGPRFRYDINLRNTQYSCIEQPYAVDEWRELKGTEFITL